jgi:chromate transporter|uniref:Chromate efflux transporter n=1 Tax=Desulfobacca acetoxidans TaxID=60893 RepID=A0A7C3SHP0_9BACT
MEKRVGILDLFCTFLHLGMTAFGGLAMIEPIRQRVVDQKGWLSQREFLDGVALCQVIPGATVVQLATYVGLRLAGPGGALAAAWAFILPAFGLMLTLSVLYFQYGELAWVKALSQGLRAVVIALLLQAFWRLGRAAGRHWLDLVIALAALAALVVRANYLLVFLVAGLLRLLLGFRLAPLGGIAGEASPLSGVHLKVILALVCGATLALTGITAGLLAFDPIMGLMTWIFIKIGLISFGGGYVMIPVLQWDVVERLGWLTLQQFMDGILLSYVTPGPLIILATFVGYWLKGPVGAALATVAVFLPPILIVMILGPFYQRLKAAGWMRHAIQGILDALVGMLALVTAQMAAVSLVDWKTWGLMLAAALALIWLEVSLLWVVAAAIPVSLAIFW